MTSTHDPLVSPQWLADHIADPKLRLIDASYKMPAARPPSAREDYLARHLPGAAFYDVDAVADPGNSLPHMVPSPEQFARYVGALGVGADSQVVVYDSGSYLGAPRAWWSFKLYGFDNVRVLEGGLKAWVADGHATEIGEVVPRAQDFAPRFDAARLRRIDQMVGNLTSKAEQVVDARSRERYQGAVVEPWPGRRPGRIPGSLNVPFTDLLNPDGTMKSPGALREVFAAAGVDLEQPIVTSCGSGVTAAVITLALTRLGVDRTALYDGSWAEWGLPDGPPVATGVS
ncbi:3-mercaptopyruvate sulfurtransferase [Rhodopseudomonas palustris]|uniref:3-mercaptopyruvate sulfurtransferase n=1 Tax=Rhodopseudomonas palustris (strain BisB18) TaxID=316056 RepID=Q216K5_RHOPB